MVLYSLTKYAGGHSDLVAGGAVGSKAIINPDWTADGCLSFYIVVKRLGQSICTFDRPRCEICPLAVDWPTAKRLRN